ncbi:MAG: hypothetical protein ACREJ3_08050 [Polyangiaceae bacterium]
MSHRRRLARTLVPAGLLQALALLWATRTEAQVHWDIGAEAGVTERVATGGGSNAPALLPGPTGEVHAHVAILPMLRVGPYLVHDIAPASGIPARQITASGLRAKLSPPWLAVPWRAWAFLGVGYARAYAPSSELAAGGPLIRGASGGFVDLPLGVGLGYRLTRAWEPFVELRARFGFVFSGSMYDEARCGCGGAFIGDDSVALSLNLGLSLNR